MSSSGIARVDRIDLKGRSGDVSRHHPHHGASYPRHRHDAIELNVVTGGRGAYVVGDRRVDLAPGRLLWLFADDDHHLASALRLDYWIVYFHPALLASAMTAADRTQLRADGPLVRDVSPEQLRLLDALCADLTRATPGPLAESGFTYLLHRAWQDTLAGRRTGPQPGPLDAAIVRVITVLREGRGAPTLSEAARLADLTPDRFARRFRAAVGCAYLGYRERALVERAAGRWSPGTSWENLATHSGFGSYRQFHRAFTRCTGLSPRAWAARRSSRS